MGELLRDALSQYELSVLSSMVQVGDATYNELLESQNPILSHKYFISDRGRIHTKLVQMQCEMESRNPNFSFEFAERAFPYNIFVPELRSKNVILHIARSPAPDVLPHEAKYKIALSNNNHALCRQLMINPQNVPPVEFEPFYGLLVFGRNRAKELFITIQFPAPGYSGIADFIDVPNFFVVSKSDEIVDFERKKAALKQEFLAKAEDGAL
jgi:hypothetical protein